MIFTQDQLQFSIQLFWFFHHIFLTALKCNSLYIRLVENHKILIRCALRKWSDMFCISQFVSLFVFQKLLRSKKTLDILYSEESWKHLRIEYPGISVSIFTDNFVYISRWYCVCIHLRIINTIPRHVSDVLQYLNGDTDEEVSLLLLQPSLWRNPKTVTLYASIPGFLHQKLRHFSAKPSLTGLVPSSNIEWRRR